MEIKGEKLEIYTGPVDAVGGAGPEAEERPAARTIHTEVSVGSLHVSDKDKADGTSFKKLMRDRQEVGTQDGSIVGSTTAGELAENLATTCRFCAWWDNEKLARSFKRMAADPGPANLTKMNELRGLLLNAGLTDVAEIDEVIVRDMGECAAYSELFKDLILTHALARCPATDPMHQPVPQCFKHRGAQTRRDAAAVRDHILMSAAGRLK